MEKIKRLRGFRDVMGEEVQKFRKIEEVSRKYLSLLGYTEIRIPLLERTELFVRSIGDSTDIVQKEMFTFIDASGESLTLRPEATAGMARAYIEANLFAKKRIARLFTMGSMFRHERPQKGRFREFNQIDVEVFGSSSPLIDAELLWVATLILKELNVENFEIQVNTVGCQECRRGFKEVLLKFVKSKLEYLCDDCRQRVNRNPLRIFDCKREECVSVLEDSPSLFDYVCESCRNHFSTFLRYLEGFNIQSVHNERLVRGLDYYTKTVFEVKCFDLGSQNAVIAGGRYDGLVKELGGPDIPGVGFAIGVERLSLVMPFEEMEGKQKVFVATVGEEARAYLFSILKKLIEGGVVVYYDPEPRSLKSQLRYADSLKVDYALIVGDDELRSKTVILRDMRSGSQRSYGADLNDLLNDLL